MHRDPGAHSGSGDAVVSEAEALAGVARNAARALGLAGNRGMLAPGLRADFVVWDVAHPAELAYWIGFNPIAGVVKDGIPVDQGATS